MGKVLVGPVRFRELCSEAAEMLQSAGHELVLNEAATPWTAADITPLLPEADAAIVGMDDWDADLISRAPQLKILSKLGVGVDNIDLTAARSHGVDVTNAPGANANAVAELAIGLMIAASRHVVRQDRAIRAGRWDRYTGVDLAGKTVGLIGFGATAQLVARRLAGFEPRLLAFDPFADADAAAAWRVTLAPLEEVLSRADVLSVHVPHLPATHHLISDAQLALLRPGAVLVNTSRGGVVDAEALARALGSGRVGAAGVDVWEVEPTPVDNPLLRFDNIVATCHGAADSYEAYAQVGRVTAQAIINRLAGGTPANVRN